MADPARASRKLNRAFLCATALSLVAGGGQAMDGVALKADHSSEPEALLIKSLVEISHSRLDSALAEIENLLKAKPNFRLAHLIKGDLLLAHARPISTMGNTNGVPQSRIEELREEARARLMHYREGTPNGRVPKYLLQMHPGQEHVIVVDTEKSRLYLYQNVKGETRYVADYYISTGKNGSGKIKEGDDKTPIGVYFVTASLPKDKLPDFYGSGAFPINYPNEWDKRLGRTGHGIWIHGKPSDTYSRPPFASNGCVALSNPDLDALATTLQIGVTPVIITDKMEWVSPEDGRAQRNELAQQLETWRRNWESRNTEQYLRHYSKNFSTKEQSLDEWAAHKHKVNAAKSWIKINLSNVSMFFYPGKDNVAVVNFEQDYASSNLSNRIKKRQYWIRENNRWRIVYEGAA